MPIPGAVSCQARTHDGSRWQDRTTHANALRMQAALPDSVALPRQTEPALRAYAALLARWTQRINLVSRGDEGQIWERHVLDSLRLVPLIPAGTTRAIDLGSGAGLPGVPLAIATGIPFDLVESDRRKATFLLEAQRVTGAPVNVHCARIETLDLAPAPVVTARALAPLEALLGLAAPLLAPRGVAFFPKGARAAEEIEAAKRSWRFGLEIAGERQQPILVITEPRRA